MIYKDIKDLRFLSWTKTRESSGTAGSYLKSFSYSNGKKIYYKLSYFDDVLGVFGYEAINEIISKMILDDLGYNHLDYNLIHALITIDNKEYKTYLNSSFDFKDKNESKITFENFYEINKFEGEGKLDFSKRYGFIKDIYNMIILDYLIVNRDRHGANIEVLYKEKEKTYRLAPMFDHGLSLLSPYYKEEDILNFDIYVDRKVNSYIGTSSLDENILYVPREFFPMKKPNFESIIKKLEGIAPTFYLDKCLKLLELRWKYLEDIRDKK